ncbi:MAG: radical SAM protein [Planctomycetota bacterium]|jgi:MoaA/NifB/PqqE/SkfB family radical SAM enzyme|nr:radical SAM protein [Planctomycetota bacterium]MDP7249769.1 radical SAM protein [Planctomycetota bacterium]
MELVHVFVPPGMRTDGGSIEPQLNARKPREKQGFDPSGPLFVPNFRHEKLAEGHLLLDTDEANWVFVNDEGFHVMNAIRGSQGKSATELFQSESPTVGKFLAQSAKREFLSNASHDKPVYTGRHHLLGLERLHEFWIVPNYDCNLRCRHCYTIEQVMHNPHRLELETCKAVVDEAKALGTEIFYLTGGEVMQHPQIFEMVEYIAKERKLILFTNGMLIDPDTAEFLARFRERLIVQISIEGHDEQNNALIRGKRAFGPALEGLRNLLNVGVRVGVSSTPTKATKESIPQLTELLCQLEVNGNRTEYHHLIMLLDIGGTKRNPERTLLTHEEFSTVMDRCKEEAKRGKKERGSRLKLANEKIMHACASNGPKKDLCGAGYTILGIDPEGNLKTCAATINDTRFDLGKVLDEQGNYVEGRITELWQNGERMKWVRAFTIARQKGEREDDLRFFHGGACWYNMQDPEKPLSTEHPFYEALEDQTLKSIIEEATKRARHPRKPGPAILSYMHRSRIACAGGRKTADLSEDGLDTGYCICFA